MGKTVIVARLKAIRYYFGEDSVAYFEPNDPKDLAKQMVRMYQNPDLRTQLAARARTEYVPIRWDLMKERYLTLIDRLSGSERPKHQESNSGCAAMGAR